MNTRRALAPAFALLAATLAACSAPAPGDTAPGDTTQSPPHVSFIGGDDCWIGCDTATPLMAGAADALFVQPDWFVAGATLPAGLTFTSDDPAVVAVGAVSVSAGDYTVPVTAGVPGSAHIVARDAEGEVFDTIELQVAAPASFVLHCPSIADAQSTEGPALTALDFTGTCIFHVDAVDAQGVTLEAGSGFSITSADLGVALVCPLGFFDSIQSCTAPSTGPVSAPDGAITTTAQGSTTIVIQAGGLMSAVTLTVP